jgi:hypothetical protein
LGAEDDFEQATKLISDWQLEGEIGS